MGRGRALPPHHRPAHRRRRPPPAGPSAAAGARAGVPGRPALPPGPARRGADRHRPPAPLPATTGPPPVATPQPVATGQPVAHPVRPGAAIGSSGIAAGWLVDPTGRHELRYWSGSGLDGARLRRRRARHRRPADHVTAGEGSARPAGAPCRSSLPCWRPWRWFCSAPSPACALSGRCQGGRRRRAGAPSAAVGLPARRRRPEPDRPVGRGSSSSTASTPSTSGRPTSCTPIRGRRGDFTQADAARIAALGFDVVRLGIIWQGIEPGTLGPDDPRICTPGPGPRSRPVERSGGPGLPRPGGPDRGHPGPVPRLHAARHARGRVLDRLRR